MSRDDKTRADEAGREADVHITREGRSYIDLESPESVRAVLGKANQYRKIRIVPAGAQAPEPA